MTIRNRWTGYNYSYCTYERAALGGEEGTKMKGYMGATI